MANFFTIFREINKLSEKKPRFIFYSENKSYLKYSYLIIEYLSKKYPGEIYYVSSDINDKILNLIYKFPTRSRITRARLEDEGQGEQNVKTSIYNKKGLMRKDQ